MAWAGLHLILFLSDIAEIYLNKFSLPSLYFRCLSGSSRQIIQSLTTTEKEHPFYTEVNTMHEQNIIFNDIIVRR